MDAVLDELTRMNRVIGYQRCLMDIQDWVKSQAGTRDIATLLALREEVARLVGEIPFRERGPTVTAGN